MNKKTVKNLILSAVIVCILAISAGCTEEPVYVGELPKVPTKYFPTPTRGELTFTFSEALLSEDGIITVTPTATVTRTPAPHKEDKPWKSETITTSTATPAPTKMASKDVNDNASAIVSKLRKYNSAMAESTPEGLKIFCNSEKKADAFVVATAQLYSMFPVLYSDASLVHTPEYYMERYPEITSLSIDYGRSGIYTNGVAIMFTDVETKAAANLLTAIRTGDESRLSGHEQWTLDEIRSLSKKMKLKEMSDIDKVLTVYSYIIKNTEYDSKASSDSHKAYGVLKNSKGVCDGYAEAFMLFMLINDVEAEVITGKADGGPHAWNQVKVDGKWYNLDLTWDDPIDTNTGRDIPNHVFYKYFMLDDKELYATHVPESSFTHKCTDRTYRLYGYKRFMANNTEGVRALIESQKSAGTVTVAVPVGTMDTGTITSVYQQVTGKTASYFPVYTIDGYRIIDIKN